MAEDCRGMEIDHTASTRLPPRDSSGPSSSSLSSHQVDEIIESYENSNFSESQSIETIRLDELHPSPLPPTQTDEHPVNPTMRNKWRSHFDIFCKVSKGLPTLSGVVVAIIFGWASLKYARWEAVHDFRDGCERYQVSGVFNEYQSDDC